MIVATVRDIARFEAIEALHYKKSSFEAEPKTQENAWQDLAQWARHRLATPRGKAIDFAKTTVGFDFTHCGDCIEVDKKSVRIRLPKPTITVTLLPDETEFISSSLNSQKPRS